MSPDDGLSPPQQRRLDQAIAEYLAAAETGTALDRAEFLARYPDVEDHLRTFLAAQDEKHQQEQAADALPPTIVTGDSATAGSGGVAPASLAVADSRRFGDYELLEEIARGGMGVVWKARHVKLNRIVALKMILAGQLAGPDDVQRFYAEAEAAAQLDHPGIVPIYEIGQHEGQHFFAMAYVEGESLAAKVAAGPLPPREAAELVMALAEAVQYAHERGVIHRDLKPSNILLQGLGARGQGLGSGSQGPRKGAGRQLESSSSVPQPPVPSPQPPPSSPQPPASSPQPLIPRITDFGLAKRIHMDSSLTATGQILGTPSYMPPEQAAGNTEAIGPAADVYALGAILYALLTGRPPFQSANVMDTLRAVLEEEPIAPRKLNSSVPLDLSTICVKCLEKELHRRYASARALADELQRYLNGKPILARPITRVERAARWIARHPKRAGAAGFALLAVVLVTWIVSAQIRAAREENDRRRAESLVEAVLTAPSDAVPYAVENLRPLSRHALPILRERFGDESQAKVQRLHAALALAALGEVDEAFFVNAIVDSPAAESRSILAALARNRETVVPRLTARAAQETKPEVKARLALSLLELGDATVARELVKVSPDPTFRTALIHQGVPTWLVSTASLRSVLEETADSALRYSLCLGVGLSPPERFSGHEKKELGEVLAKLYREAPDGATHSAADWTLRQWQIKLPKLPRGKLADKPASRDWFVNTLGMTLVKIPAGTFTMGKQAGVEGVEVTLTRPFWLGSTEVTVEQFEKFTQDAKYFAGNIPGRPKEHPAEQLSGIPTHDANVSHTPDSPMQRVCWSDAASYCNWLSRKEGLTPCYEREFGTEWILKNEASGYRLPTEAEWEYACRAGTSTEFCFGNGESLLGSYAVYMVNSELRAAPVGSKLPNAWGLFDMHGNVFEWCQDGHPKLPRSQWLGRDGMLRGGCWDPLERSSCRSAFRFFYARGTRATQVGFRVALVQPR